MLAKKLMISVFHLPERYPTAAFSQSTFPKTKKEQVGTHVDEIDESISNAGLVSSYKIRTKKLNLLAIVAEVDAEVHEIVASKARLIDILLQLGLGNLVRDVAQHNLRSLALGFMKVIV
jgi:hypothetical protein